MLYIVVAVIFGVVAGMVAQAKGRSPFGWFLVGFLIGPFSLVVLALPPRPREGAFSECPACFEVVKSQAVICRHCGTSLG